MDVAELPTKELGQSNDSPQRCFSDGDRAKLGGYFVALTMQDAKIVLGMIARGDNKHDRAAWFGENQARIAEVEAGSHGSISAAPANELPPKGAPGPKGKRMRAFAGKALAELKDGKTDEAIKTLQAGIAAYDRHGA